MAADAPAHPAGEGRRPAAGALAGRPGERAGTGRREGPRTTPSIARCQRVAQLYFSIMFVNCVTLIGTGASTIAPVYGGDRVLDAQGCAGVGVPARNCADPDSISGTSTSPNRVGVASRCDSVQSNRSDITSEAEILGNRYRGAAKVCMAVRVRHGDLLGNTRNPAQLKRDRFWRGAVASYPAGPVQHDAPGRGRRERRVMLVACAGGTPL